MGNRYTPAGIHGIIEIKASRPPKRYDVVDEYIQFPPRARLEQKALGSPATQATWTSEGSSHSKIL
ncbi:hypothetical protein GQ607_002967, partial [Colletotrichum asianum]